MKNSIEPLVLLHYQDGVIKASRNVNNVTQPHPGMYIVNFSAALANDNYIALANSSNGYIAATSCLPSDVTLENRDGSGRLVYANRVMLAVYVP